MVEIDFERGIGNEAVAMLFHSGCLRRDMFFVSPRHCGVKTDTSDFIHISAGQRGGPGNAGFLHWMDQACG